MRQMILPHADLAGLAEEVLHQGGMLRLRVRGTSMMPALFSGDTIVVQPVVDVSSLQAGDIVLYQKANENLVVHRIVGRRLQKGQMIYIVRGDAHRDPGESVAFEQILGRVVQRERNGGVVYRMLAFLRHRAYPFWAWIQAARMPCDRLKFPGD